MSYPVLQSALTCPACGHVEVETMPTNACLFFYECPSCHMTLRPRPGDCCWFCSYESVRCPPNKPALIVANRRGQSRFGEPATDIDHVQVAVAVRFMQSALHEWASAHARGTSVQRINALPRYTATTGIDLTPAWQVSRQPPDSTSTGRTC